MMEVVELNEIRREDWAELVDGSSVATWFQTKEAYVFFGSLSFWERFGFAVKTDGKLKGVVLGVVQREGGIVRRFLSRRAIVFGGPLLSNDITEGELAELLHETTKRLKKKAIYIEMRNFNDYSRWKKTFESAGFRYDPHLNVHVDTTSWSVVERKLDRNRRRNIKKARENGVVIDSNPTLEDVRTFYSMLERLYRTKVKTPLYPFEFFERLRETRDARFFMAKTKDGVLIGGLACVVLEKHAVYAWMACGEDRQYSALSPSVMVNYAGIQYASEQGFPCFDFMGAGKPDDGGYGVRDFKLKFGGDLVEHGRYVFVCDPLLYGIGKLGVKILRKK